MTRPFLVLDAATYRGTAAVVVGDRVLAEGETAMRGEHEERLMPAVAAVLREACVEPAALAGIVCGAGPGSFTSLRIAASLAKGLSTATARPLLAVSSLLLIVAGMDQPPTAGRYLALLDAMRGDRFAARIAMAAGGVPVMESDVGLVDGETALRIARAEDRTMIGPGQEVDALPRARGVARLWHSLGAVREVDPLSWEPSYGRLAEAQVQWERDHGRRLGA